MNIFSSNGPFSLLTGVNDEPPRLTRAQVIHRDNERSNLETITRLVIRALLEDAMKSSNRLIEGDSQMLSDLLMMLEKVLFHGFKSSMKSSLIVLRTPDAELWSMIIKIGKINELLRESVCCIDKLDALITPISKVRGILRLIMMQKKLSDFFEAIINFVNLKDYYENWAFLRQEKAVVLSGALVGIRVIECNLVLDYDNLQEQPLSVDLSLYVKLPTISSEQDIDVTSNGKEEKMFNKERKTLLDQNNFLEERIRQLETNIEDLKRKIALDQDSKSEISFNSFMAVSYRPSEDGDDVTNENVSQPQQQQQNESSKELETLKFENDTLATKVIELEDSLSLAQEQVKDKTKVCTDLYEKLRLAEECTRKVENDFIRLKDHYNEDKQMLCTSIEKLQEKNEITNKLLAEKNKSDDNLRLEFQKKCEQYSRTIGELETKQKLLLEAQEERRVLEQEVLELPKIKEQNKKLQQQLNFERERADDNEKALEELGGRLCESKLRMVELTEELLPLTDAQWAKDSDVANCTACDELFSFSKRKHHCRMCGSIFCSTCSEYRVKLPSNPKPARVCLNCFSILQVRSPPRPV